MSKLKTPRAKKAASLLRDRRSVYGENSKASRKNIPRSKTRMQRAHRRAVHQTLTHAEPLSSEMELEQAENKLVKASRERQIAGFRKTPDITLSEYLVRKHKRPTRRGV